MASAGARPQLRRMSHRHCSGAILAGGANTRFAGEAKGLAEVGGRRIVDRAVEALHGAVDETFLITNDGRVSAAIPNVRSYPDRYPRRASLVGLHSALWHCREAVIVVAWDMPFVTSELLSALRARGEAAHAAVLPLGPRGPEPFCAYYPRAVIDVVERQIDVGELRLSAFVAALPGVVTLSPNDLTPFGRPEQLFMNVNSAADLAAARNLDRVNGSSSSEVAAAVASDPEHR